VTIDGRAPALLGGPSLDDRLLVLLPLAEAADQRARVHDAVLPEIERRPGARFLVRSGAVGHDRPVLVAQLRKPICEVPERHQDGAGEMTRDVAVRIAHVKHQDMTRLEERLELRWGDPQLGRGQFGVGSSLSRAVGRRVAGRRRIRPGHSSVKTTLGDHQPLFGLASADERIAQTDHVEACRAKFAIGKPGIERMVLRLPGA